MNCRCRLTHINVFMEKRIDASSSKTPNSHSILANPNPTQSNRIHRVESPKRHIIIIIIIITIIMNEIINQPHPPQSLLQSLL